MTAIIKNVRSSKTGTLTGDIFIEIRGRSIHQICVEDDIESIVREVNMEVSHNINRSMTTRERNVLIDTVSKVINGKYNDKRFNKCI